MHISEVFTPGDTPDITYVERGRGEKEDELKLQINKSSFSVSVTGPSKTGKSALIDKVTKENKNRIEDVIEINGKEINSENDFWTGVLDGLNRPAEKSSTVTNSDTGEISGSVGVNLGGFNASAGGKSGSTESESASLVFKRSVMNYMNNIFNDGENKSIVIFVDDAHYIPKDIHEDIAENIKMAYEYGLDFCFAYIPYKSDDLTKANNELQTRTQHIKLEEWTQEELEEIAELGFDAIDLEISENIKKNFARESVKSPYLMQELCYRFCATNNIYDSTDVEEPINLTDEEVKEILRDLADSLEYPTAYSIISGEKRGRSDKTFDFSDGSHGNRYVALMRGLTANPPKSGFELSTIKERIEEKCENESPEPGNITGDIKRVSKWMDESGEDSMLFDFSGDKIEMIDPSLIFHLRWSRETDFEPEFKSWDSEE